MNDSSKIKYLSIALAGLLGGCAHQLPPVNAISVSRISSVESEVKRQLSVYQSKVNELRNHAVPIADFKCGNGSIDFDIESVKLDLTTTFDTTKSGSIGLTVPVSAGSVGGTAAGSREVADTEELAFYLYPIPQPGYTYDGPAKAAPLSDALIALRAALIEGAKAKSICVHDFDPSDPSHDPGGTYTFGTTITDGASGGVEIKLAILEISGKIERKSATGNSIAATFHQSKTKNGNIDVGTGVAIPASR